jgi:hypothetical protein
VRIDSFPGALVVVATLGAFSAGCGSSTAEGASPMPDAADLGDGGGAAPPPPEGGANGDDGSLDAASPPRQAFLRIVHASPDSPPLDVCVALHGTQAFQGPLVAQLAAALSVAAGDDGGDAGAAPGLAYSQVSAYVSVDAGSYDVRIVAAGASGCAAAPPVPADGGPDAEAGAPPDAGAAGVATFEAGAGTFTTILVAGDLVPAGDDALVGVTALTDDSVLPGGAARLRAVNAVSSAPALDFGLGSAPAWLPMFVDVAFGAAGTAVAPGEGAADSNGYLPVGALASQAVSARAAADSAAVVAAASSVDVEVGAIATLFAIGGKTGDAAHPPALLVCIDNQPSGGLLSDCSVAQ